MVTLTKLTTFRYYIEQNEIDLLQKRKNSDSKIFSKFVVVEPLRKNERDEFFQTKEENN